jgi:hypothetical protein
MASTVCSSAASGSGFGPDDPPGKSAGHEGAGDLQDLAEPAGGDQPDPGSLALQDRVGGDRRPVQHRAHLGQRDASRLAGSLHPPEHTDGLVMWCRGGLRPPRVTGRLVHEQDVSEGATDINPNR